MRMAPGNPFTSEKKLPPEIEANLNAFYGLDQPWYAQYWDYLVRIVNWDFGPSFKYKSQTVNDLINDGFPVSLALGAEAILIAVAIGVLLGVIAALNQNKWPDYSAYDCCGIRDIYAILHPCYFITIFPCYKNAYFSCSFMGISYAHRIACASTCSCPDGLYSSAYAFIHA